MKKGLVLLSALILTALLFMPGECAYAKSKYPGYEIEPQWISGNEMTLYTGQRETPFCIGCGLTTGEALDMAVYDKIMADLSMTIEDPSVAVFTGKVIAHDGDDDIFETYAVEKGNFMPALKGLKPGKTTLTCRSKLLEQTLKLTVIVKDAELICRDVIYYAGNEYSFEMRGNAQALSYQSSNEGVAKVDSDTGVVTALKKGKAVISCSASDGRTYTKNMTVRKPGLTYTKLNLYSMYDKGKQYGCDVPLVAAGLKVKSWKSSDTSVVKVKKYGDSLAILHTKKPGKCTITCTTVNGQKYKCSVTVKRYDFLKDYVSVAELKKCGFYNDIYTIKDYGNVVVFIGQSNAYYNPLLKLDNGNKVLDMSAGKTAGDILKNRYMKEGRFSKEIGADYVDVKSGKKGMRIWMQAFYLDD